MISVVIPCINKHTPLLPELIRAYETQTIKPDEIVVVLSGGEPPCLNSSIPIKLCCHKQRKYAGEARQLGSELSEGDFIIYNDSDDLPHPQRVEILDHFFTKFNAAHINALWGSAELRFTYNIDRIPFILAREILERNTMAYQPYGGWLKSSRVHAGNTAIRRDVLDRVMWANHKKGQDRVFCLDVLHTFKSSMILLVELIQYRLELSSWRVDD